MRLKLRLNRRKIEFGTVYVVGGGRFEVFKSVEGFYCIHNTIVNRTTYYSNYALMRVNLTEVLR